MKNKILNPKTKTLFSNKKNILLKTTLSLIAVCFLCYNVKAQNHESGKLNVRVTNTNLLPTINKDGSLNVPTALSSLFNTYAITGMEQSYPAAVHFLGQHPNAEPLTRWYSLEGSFDAVALQTEIETNYTSTFDQTELIYPSFPLHTPNDYGQNGSFSYTPANLDLYDMEGAWNISKGDPSVWIGASDFYGIDPNHPDWVNTDNTNQIAWIQSGFNSTDFTSASGCTSTSCHGHEVVSVFGAGTNNISGIAGTGYKCRAMIAAAGSNNVLELAAAGAKVINMSYGGCGISFPDQSGFQMLHDLGVVLISTPGNGNLQNGATSCNIHGYMYPGSYDAVMSIGGSNNEDKFFQGTEYTSFNDRVDLTGGAFMIPILRVGGGASDGWNGAWGTSFSAPAVAGVAGLIMANNNVLGAQGVKDIIKHNTDNIYLNSNNIFFLGGGGTGRLNAHKSLQASNAAKNNTSLDLYVKDHEWEFSGPMGFDNDQSPDIWVRNTPNGRTHFLHQTPSLDINDPSDQCYIYVRVRNNSNSICTGLNEKVTVYWSNASTWSSWPANWDGTNPSIGNWVGKKDIPALGPGEVAILEFPWRDNVGGPSNVCFMARITGVNGDNITLHPNRLDKDIRLNNNIAVRNTTFRTQGILHQLLDPNAPVGHAAAHLGSVLVGNPTNGGLDTYDLQFEAFQNELDLNVIDISKLYMHLDNAGWILLNQNQGLENEEYFEIVDNNSVRILSPNFTLEDLQFPTETRVNVDFYINIYSEDQTEGSAYPFKLRQRIPNSDTILGSEEFIVLKEPNVGIDADAGGDVTTDGTQPITLTASQIAEQAEYNWYDEEGNLVYTGTSFQISPNESEEFTLEIVSLVDGEIAEDEIVITVNPHRIISLNPNPASSTVNISYDISEANSSYISIVPTNTNGVAHNYVLNNTSSDKQIDISSYPTGLYQVVLICDGQIADSKNLIIQ